MPALYLNQSARNLAEILADISSIYLQSCNVTRFTIYCFYDFFLKRVLNYSLSSPRSVLCIVQSTEYAHKHCETVNFFTFYFYDVQCIIIESIPIKYCNANLWYAIFASTLCTFYECLLHVLVNLHHMQWKWPSQLDTVYDPKFYWSTIVKIVQHFSQGTQFGMIEINFVNYMGNSAYFYCSYF